MIRSIEDLQWRVDLASGSVSYDDKTLETCRQKFGNAPLFEGEPVMERMLRFFEYAHLPPDLQDASRPFCELAEQLVADLAPGPERTVALRKLLEAKDAAVRARIEMRPIALPRIHHEEGTSKQAPGHPGT